MKSYFWIDCGTVKDIFNESEMDRHLSVLDHIRMEFHLLLCPRCSAELRNLRYLEEIMRTDFFPASPDFEELIMRRLPEDADIEEKNDVPAGFPLRGWVVIGFFVLISLSSSFFGINFVEIANAAGLSFLLPVGLTIGMVVTCYGALFISSHLKELSTRFRLR